MIRDKLFKQLSPTYGVSLYWSRPIWRLMDGHPLIVDEQVPIDEVSQLATSREVNKLYDYVVITEEGKICGVSSIRSILEAITKVRVEQARVANPLTGLPGNVLIQRELTRRLTSASRCAVVYADLDYFKWYNDRYGFHQGDRLIQFTADMLLEASRICGAAGDFVGHIGGDDFIVITNALEPQLLGEEMIRRFNAGVGAFYEGEDRLHVRDREGNPVEAGGVTISLSLIVCECSPAITAEVVSQEAAKLKKQAKGVAGSVCLFRELKGLNAASARVNAP